MDVICLSNLAYVPSGTDVRKPLGSVTYLSVCNPLITACTLGERALPTSVTGRKYKLKTFRKGPS